ncbi:cytochrome oxidase Cu insertion factor (SCO1/SenC/PrrC family) [Dysgonomonas sp. PFB1-18]|uniref:nitrophenyl compound nitroreductase subunit ArsF family protein n=1 Tax=unclassified Dysgonomonas TaxID=2630389 RepID=UPI00247675AB|nr:MULTISPECIES: nitrophenyl compound nitroreductase subunit ArsF family protein [unclassified Dysgonomonas]MDH6310242.1 cytochrome oxidase Cu insertion factor (SCO1/SenC/PrrC family) [Dysgonomonas sp. PF1-14]MDH6340060.1 cytochrome oxidase Cu insertion factor (SCO1/SenC/PrrC family) [Dysgonomonas sp. PF1-16]MDH6381833.1 cytochrome oxidase Cu insertion factor (SCO1/SenC/PrrC family) [Dysgonomonas sp. PFB1-18]MDH6398925.1 cytochrome oxidase Cu insertion factor (SCO1/SenC/PrrC family) [Dysgonomon
MNKSLLVLFLAVFFVACGSKTENKQAENQTIATADVSLVDIYYFHGKQRCKTCIAVGDLAKKTIEETYSGNDKVKFIEIDTSNKQFEDLVNKYEVSWNALIIAKGENSVDITEQAFANAVNNPDVLSDLIKEEVNKRIN